MDSPDDFADGAPVGREGPAAPTVRRTSSAFGTPGIDSTVRRHDLNDVFIRHQDATFMMRAAGSEMHGAGIDDGDILLVDRALTARHGVTPSPEPGAASVAPAQSPCAVTSASARFAT